MATLININKMSMWVQADGRLAHNPFTKNWDVIYPRGMAGVVYADAILWGGLIHDGRVIRYRGYNYQIRVGGSRYKSGLQPGRIVTKGCIHTPDTARIDSMYIAQWSDADIGSPGDDLVGCDALLNMDRFDFIHSRSACPLMLSCFLVIP